MLDIAVNEYKMKLNDFYERFLKSRISEDFSSGDSSTIAGRSGKELFAEVMNLKDSDRKKLEKVQLPISKSPEYWTGWLLAHYQWSRGVSFRMINDDIPIETIINMYHPYHEMDITKTDEIFIKYIKIENKLKLLREKNNLSQSELALLSEIPIRNIRAYEQGKIELYNAKGETLYKLSKALKKSPTIIAEELKDKIILDQYIEKI